MADLTFAHGSSFYGSIGLKTTNRKPAIRNNGSGFAGGTMSDRSFSNDAFENVRDQIGFCGIWCGSCAVGNGALRELTARYHRLIAAYGLESWAPKELDYEQFVEWLDGIGLEASCPGCHQGGGREACPMRTCAHSKGIGHCADCGGSSACTHSKDLLGMRSGARSAGLFVEPDDGDPLRLMEGWIEALKRSWPSTILF
ncbi:DUF3795 domain-containing protein [Candidatus Bipolaricaulota bacterium]|nr:DUF3795 domain-containing protein [Candidatus Bipolaricaulota bacterium]